MKSCPKILADINTKTPFYNQIMYETSEDKKKVSLPKVIQSPKPTKQMKPTINSNKTTGNDMIPSFLINKKAKEAKQTQTSDSSNSNDNSNNDIDNSNNKNDNNNQSQTLPEPREGKHPRMGLNLNFVGLMTCRNCYLKNECSEYKPDVDGKSSTCEMERRLYGNVSAEFKKLGYIENIVDAIVADRIVYAIIRIKRAERYESFFGSTTEESFFIGNQQVKKIKPHALTSYLRDAERTCLNWMRELAATRRQRKSMNAQEDLANILSSLMDEKKFNAKHERRINARAAIQGVQ